MKSCPFAPTGPAIRGVSSGRHRRCRGSPHHSRTPLPDATTRVEGDHELRPVGGAGALPERACKVYAIRNSRGRHEDNPDSGEQKASHGALQSGEVTDQLRRKLFVSEFQLLLPRFKGRG